MGRSQDSYGKKEVRNKKEKKRKEKEKKRLEKRDKDTSGSLDDMIAYVDAFGNLSSTPPDPKDIEEIDPEEIEVSTPKKEDIPYDPIRKGIVSFLNESKGFGFIKDTETQESIFVHVNNTLEEIREGNLVSFEVEMGPKGPSAIKVKVAR
ncbi:MAG: cold shock domain-containing protein [Bacteroides sp.]|jgi:cold shock CspA family protein|nr:cold shock domain-containing protein [Bacteroides sp.]